MYVLSPQQTGSSFIEGPCVVKGAPYIFAEFMHKKKKQENPRCDCSDHLRAGAPGDVVTRVFESQYLPVL